MQSILLPAATLKPSAITLPGSKSISNRILLLAALSDNTCTIHNLLKSDDTDRMLKALQKLGVTTEQTTHNALKIHGCGGSFPEHKADLFLGNAGTAFRPLTAVLGILGGDYRLHGVPRMHQRPIGDLVDALRLLGADIRYINHEHYPPLHINRSKPNNVRVIPIKGNVSSQFLTALMMALPLTGNACTINITDELISKPYIALTIKLMAQFGVNVEHHNYRVFHIPADTRYHAPQNVYVEGDASGASYFLAAGLLSGEPIRVNGVGKNSIQGDIAFAYELEKIGAHVVWGDNFIEVSRAQNQTVLPFDIDANHIPDAAMTLAVITLAAGAPCSLRNIGSWRVKETDRIAAMAAELRKVGASVVEEAESIHISPPAVLTPNAQIDTYDDHRMAMCFSLVSLLGVPVTINNPQCTHKTFPDYFEAFASLRKQP